MVVCVHNRNIRKISQYFQIIMILNCTYASSRNGKSNVELKVSAALALLTPSETHARKKNFNIIFLQPSCAPFFCSNSLFQPSFFHTGISSMVIINLYTHIIRYYAKSIIKFYSIFFVFCYHKKIMITQKYKNN